jgi:multiple sugar transport system permease protein
MSTFNHGRRPVLAGDGEAASTAPSGRRSDLSRAQARVGYLFVMPSLVLYLAFVLAPVLVTVYLSFTAYDPLAGATWVGLDNYHRFLTDDRSLQIYWNTLSFAIFSVTFNVVIGLLI